MDSAVQLDDSLIALCPKWQLLPDCRHGTIQDNAHRVSLTSREHAAFRFLGVAPRQSYFFSVSFDGRSGWDVGVISAAAAFGTRTKSAAFVSGDGSITVLEQAPVPVYPPPPKGTTISVVYDAAAGVVFVSVGLSSARVSVGAIDRPVPYINLREEGAVVTSLVPLAHPPSLLPPPSLGQARSSMALLSTLFSTVVSIPMARSTALAALRASFAPAILEDFPGAQINANLFVNDVMRVFDSAPIAQPDVNVLVDFIFGATFASGRLRDVLALAGALLCRPLLSADARAIEARLAFLAPGHIVSANGQFAGSFFKVGDCAPPPEEVGRAQAALTKGADASFPSIATALLGGVYNLTRSYVREVEGGDVPVPFVLEREAVAMDLLVDIYAASRDTHPLANFFALRILLFQVTCTCRPI
jgi:hypothetical protein